MLVIDVSKFQGNIDWKKVKAAGVKGAIIRLGYRGYASAGTLVTDPYFLANVKGCEDNGIPWGVYFFSQAKNEAEGREEADYTLKLLAQVKPALPSFPIYIDTERSTHPTGNGRADKISKANRTAAMKGFCERIEKAGYFAGIYASTSWFNSMLNDNELLSYTHWVAHYASKCGYKKDHGMWQYSSSGKVNGVKGNCDVNKCYVDFPSVIKNAGLNGYKKPSVKKRFSVVATGKDLEAFENLAKSLSIKNYEVVNV